MDHFRRRQTPPLLLDGADIRTADQDPTAPDPLLDEDDSAGLRDYLTKTYNPFHDPNERSDDIAELRRLHAAMDRVVLDASGWSDLQPTCDFFPEHEDEEAEAREEGGRQRWRRYRYRWPDEVRDVVLGRLLELNRKRAGQ